MKSQQTETTAASGFISHLIELRNRLVYIVAGLVLVALCLSPFANTLFTYLAMPILEQLPDGSSMMAIDVISPFLVPFKWVMLLSVIITIPYTLYHVWAFIAPGLYKHEKKLVVPLLFSSTVLFYLGVAFAYFLVFPVVFNFTLNIGPEAITVNPDISKYLDLVIALFLAFGIAFEVPVAAVLLVAMGITTPETLATKRPYIVIGAFVVGMLLTPPDVVSQIMLAIPIWILYEAGIIASRLMQRKKTEDAEVDADS